MNGLHSLRSRSAIIGLAGLLLTLGCTQDVGPTRYDISGSVQYDGRPIPVGEVCLEPDASRGNSGPGCIAPIKDGQYRSEPGKGIVGGPYIVRIVGFDGVSVGDSSQGTGLFVPYQTQVEFAKQPAIHDLSVPKSPIRGRYYPGTKDRSRHAPP